MTESDTDLVRRAQADDIDAFCLLAQRYARRIHLLAFHYCRNAQDAEDLSQDVWLKAYQALRSFRSDSSFYTWLRRITINAFLNHRRSSVFRWRGQTTAVQLVQIDSEPLEFRPVSPEKYLQQGAVRKCHRRTGRTDTVAAARVPAAPLRRNDLRRNRQRNELFIRHGEEGRLARDYETARQAFARV